ncbi:ATP-binding protein [Embleya sp. NPDC055664]
MTLPLTTSVGVARSLPAVPGSAWVARHLVWEVCDRIGIDGDRRADVGLMVTELVVEALRGGSVVTSYTLDVTGGVGDRGPVLAVVFREIGCGWPPPRRVLEEGRGLAIVAALAAEWPHRECGWLTPKLGATSWFIVGDATPERARLLPEHRLLHLRGVENVHRVGLSDVGSPLRCIDWGCDY